MKITELIEKLEATLSAKSGVKTSDKLKTRLLKDLGISVVALERVQRGPSGKSAGTWAWCARTDTGLEIGSEDTMRQCGNASQQKVSAFAGRRGRPSGCYTLTRTQPNAKLTGRGESA